MGVSAGQGQERSQGESKDQEKDQFGWDGSFYRKQAQENRLWAVSGDYIFIIGNGKLLTF